jgi:hypothetical protein
MVSLRLHGQRKERLHAIRAASARNFEFESCFRRQVGIPALAELWDNSTWSGGAYAKGDETNGFQLGNPFVGGLVEHKSPSLVSDPTHR